MNFNRKLNTIWFVNCAQSVVEIEKGGINNSFCIV